ncbi:phage tail tape measure protein, TP901 family [Ligilactobacillus agilis DSM 20509]|uniref:Phage tail tape measure protein, TP901 family n=1 Tax=Ligilactobacillus agilis DSM 20509 TaxID=1423718 RepID=A0A0R2A6G2_9LACO|nr:phage tail tape measure protein, TP901 family [Ligilactobacillus agilis DSM 20509]
MLIKGANKASELNSQYNVIKNNLVTGGESVAEATRAIARMQADGEKYSLRYGKSQKEIADAYLELVKRGYTSQQAIGAMNTELQGSIASGDEFSDVVEVASQTLEGFGMTVDKNGKQLSSAKEMTEQTKKAVNTLAYSADVTSTSFQSLGVGMSYVSSTAHQAGFTLAETASAMGVLSNAGLEADKALVKLAA